MSLADKNRGFLNITEGRLIKYINLAILENTKALSNGDDLIFHSKNIEHLCRALSYLTDMEVD